MLTTVATLSRSSIPDTTALGIFTDYTYAKLRTVTVGGKVETFAALGTFPFGIVSDGSGGYFYSDPTRHIVSKIDANKNVVRWAGVTYTAGTTQGSYPDGKLFNPSWMVKDTAGNLYVACNYGNGDLFQGPQIGNIFNPNFISYAPYIAKITPSQVISRYTFLPMFFPGYTNPRNNSYKDWIDGNISSAIFGNIFNLCIDQNNNIYLIDFCPQPSANYSAEARIGIRKITSAGVVSTVEYVDWVGSVVDVYNGLACAPDGTLFYSKITSPVPAQNSPYGATSRIYRRQTNGTVTQIAGSGLLLNNETFLVKNPLDYRAATDSLTGLNANFYAASYARSRCMAVNATKTMLYDLEPNQVLRTIGLSGNFPVSKLAGSYSETAFADGIGSGASWNDAGQFLLL